MLKERAYVLLLCMALNLIELSKCRKVVQVITLIRHGARTGNSNLLKTDLVEENGKGKLTANGQRMLYTLGSEIRLQYPTIFNSSFSQDDLKVFSSASGRCMQSAASFLLGINPLSSGENITPKGSEPNPKYINPPIKGLNVELPGEFALPYGYLASSIISKPYETDLLFQPWIQYVCPKYGGEALASY